MEKKKDKLAYLSKIDFGLQTTSQYLQDVFIHVKQCANHVVVHKKLHFLTKLEQDVHGVCFRLVLRREKKKKENHQGGYILPSLGNFIKQIDGNC